MVEVYGEGSALALLPHLLRGLKVKDESAGGGVSGGNKGISEQRLGDEGSKSGEGCEEAFNVSLFDGTRMKGVAFGSDKGCGEVFEEDGQVEAVGDSDVGDDVQVVLTLVGRDDEGVGFELGMGRVDVRLE
jgi:hypothetical protein